MADQTEPEKNKKQSKSGKKVQRAKKKKGRAPTGSCFVLMPFKEPFDTYYSAIIEPAILSVHLHPLRGDSLFRPSPIMADVWQMIQDAKVLVAELTERNANVFYELGLAHAIGKPVVLISETIADVPFDLQPLRVLLYDKSDPAWGAALNANLITSLKETLRDITEAVPSMFRKIVKSQAPEELELGMRVSDLERRVAAISPSSLRADWEQSAQDIGHQIRLPMRPEFISREVPTTPHFISRGEAVDWAIFQMRKYPPTMIRDWLRKSLSNSETETVLRLAMQERQLRGKVRKVTPTKRSKQTRKR